MPRHDYAASPGGTMRNKKTGQCKGVTKSGSKYRAKVWCTEQGKYKNLGSFDSEHEAAASVASAEASGTQYLPSPRQYMKRTFALTQGALLLAQTTRSRPTDALTDFWFCLVRFRCWQHQRETCLCSSGSNGSSSRSSRSSSSSSSSSRSLRRPPSRSSTRYSTMRRSTQHHTRSSAAACCPCSPEVALGRPRLRAQCTRCVRGHCRPACVLHASLRLRFVEQRHAREGGA